MLIILVGIIGLVLGIIAVQRVSRIFSKRDVDERQWYISELINSKTFPTFTPEEQVLFLFDKDDGLVLRKIGVHALESMYFNLVIKISKAQVIEEMNKPAILQKLTLSNSFDGIWIKSVGPEFEVVEQERGRLTPHKSFQSKDEMLNYLYDLYTATTPSYRLLPLK